MGKTQPTRTVKKKFLTADKIGKGVKAVGKPVATVVALVGITMLKDNLISKGGDDDSDDDDDDE